MSPPASASSPSPPASRGSSEAFFHLLPAAAVGGGAWASPSLIVSNVSGRSNCARKSAPEMPKVLEQYDWIEKMLSGARPPHRGAQRQGRAAARTTRRRPGPRTGPAVRCGQRGRGDLFWSGRSPRSPGAASARVRGRGAAPGPARAVALRAVRISGSFSLNWSSSCSCALWVRSAASSSVASSLRLAWRGAPPATSAPSTSVRPGRGAGVRRRWPRPRAAPSPRGPSARPRTLS